MAQLLCKFEIKNQLIVKHSCYNYLSMLINCLCLRHYNITQPASNAALPLVCYSKLLTCYIKLFCRAITQDKLLFIEIKIFCPLLLW